MRLFDFSLRAKGFKIDKAKILLSQIKNKSENEFEAYVLERKKAILEFHFKHNSFYKVKGKDIYISDWNSIPILTKRELQKPLYQLLSDGFSKKNIHR